MAAPPVVVPGATSARSAAPAAPVSADQLWSMLGWAGFVFTAIGVLDVALAWFPPGLGNPEWEFGTISATLNGLAMPAVGLALLLAGVASRGSRVGTRVVAVLCVLLALFVIGAAALYVTVLPVAIDSASANPVIEAGIRKAAIKASGLSVLYIALFLALGIKGFRLVR